MDIHKRESLIEKISDGSDLSNAMLVALKRCNQKIQRWIDNLPQQIHCMLCGFLIEKSELLFYAEDTPQFIYDESSGSVKANRFVFGLCTKCAEELKKDEEAIDDWDSRLLLPWQKELLEGGNWDMSNFHTRGEAKRFIIDWLKN